MNDASSAYHQALHWKDCTDELDARPPIGLTRARSTRPRDVLRACTPAGVMMYVVDVEHMLKGKLEPQTKTRSAIAKPSTFPASAWFALPDPTHCLPCLFALP